MAEEPSPHVSPTPPPSSFPASSPPTLCRKLFTSLLRGDELNINKKTIKRILSSEIIIDTSNLDRELIQIMPYMFIVYVKKWDGWRSKAYQSYQNGDITLDTFFRKFFAYLQLKLNQLMTRDFSEAVQSLRDNSELPTYAPYSLVIEASPTVANSLIFGSKNNDIVMTQYTGVPWTDINTTELIHWPYVQVDFCTSSLSFHRQNASEYIRYLNLSPIEHQFVRSSQIDIENLFPGLTRKCYHYQMFVDYVTKYIDFLKQMPDSLKLSLDRIEEIETILNNFLQDILDINVERTLATKTNVVFQLNEMKYTRTLKVVDQAREHEPQVEYVEIITPKVQLRLNFFTPNNKLPHMQEEVDKNNSQTSKKSNSQPHYPVIRYSCTFCKVSYAKLLAKQEFIDHLKKHHSTEPPVFCMECRQFMPLKTLAGQRWMHTCNKV